MKSLSEVPSLTGGPLKRVESGWVSIARSNSLHILCKFLFHGAIVIWGAFLQDTDFRQFSCIRQSDSDWPVRCTEIGVQWGV